MLCRVIPLRNLMQMDALNALHGKALSQIAERLWPPYPFFLNQSLLDPRRRRSSRE